MHLSSPTSLFTSPPSLKFSSSRSYPPFLHFLFVAFSTSSDPLEDEDEEDEDEDGEAEEEEFFEAEEPQCFDLHDSNRPVVYLEIGSHESRIGVWNEKENSFELR